METNYQDLKERATREIDANKDRLIDLSRRIHANPELSMEEHRACRWLSDELEREGFRVERGIGGLATSFRAVCPGRAERPKVAIFAEYDALAGLGHACGHNLIAASAVGVGIGLKKLMPELDGALVILGTPGEEAGGGKIILIEKGAFGDLDAAFMIHPAPGTFVGKRYLAVVGLEIKFRGKAAHAAAAPEKGINALDAVIETFNNINALRQHLPEDVRIHGIITDGGTAPNIVPEFAAARFGVRTIEQDFLPVLLEKVKNCAKAAALATGAELELNQFHYAHAAEAMKLNPPLDEAFRENMIRLGLTIDKLPERGGMGSTDMGNVSQVLPSSHPSIAIGPKTLVGHSREFRDAAISDRGHEAMILAAKAMALTALDLFTKPDLLNEVKRAFVEG